MAGKYKFNHGQQNPQALAEGKRLDAVRTLNRDEHMQLYVTPPLSADSIDPYNPQWENSTSTDASDIRNIQSSLGHSRNNLKYRYPFTYTIPEEKKWNLHRRFTDERGNALPIDRDPVRGVMGKVMLGPDYFAFVNKMMQKEEAEAFKCFCYNQMDISTPVKKAYWKKRCPELYQELVDGLFKKMSIRFKEDTINLLGAENEQDYEWLWENVVKKQLYTTDYFDANVRGQGGQVMQYPPQAPTTKPYPQGEIDLATNTRNPDGLMNLRY